MHGSHENISPLELAFRYIIMGPIFLAAIVIPMLIGVLAQFAIIGIGIYLLVSWLGLL